MKPTEQTKLILLTCLLGTAALVQANAVTIPESTALADSAVDKTKPGFIWRIFANQANQVNSSERAEAALAGQLLDADGAPLPNLADPGAAGVASGAAKPPASPTAPVEFEIPTVINVSPAAGSNFGNFQPDEQMPGVPASDSSNNGLAVEIITYLDLPAGDTAMVVNSDDGFRATAGNLNDIFLGSVLGQFEGGRGAGDTPFTVTATKAGIYPFRILYEQGGGDANIEWFTVKADGTKVLVNDSANGGIKAYRAATLPPKETAVKSVNPSPVPRQANKVGSSLQIVLSDGDTKKVDDNSIALQLDGKTATLAKTRLGSQVTLTYTPEGLQVPTDKHTANLSFKDSAGGSRTQDWTFYGLKNIVVPAPKITENFDSYPEDTQPTGWVAWNFTAHCDDGRDPSSQNSESFENWVLISTNNAPSIDGGSLNVAPGQTFNGQPVTTISSGNILYAESDSRCGNAADTLDSLGRPYVGQTQFIISKPFDCSQMTNVLLSFSALYTQNQDSLGAVEYSIDGGTNWMPIVYYLEGPDIVLKADGSVDAVATFTAPNTDTSSWTNNGVRYGAGAHGYGDGIASPITQDLALYVAERINDDQFEGARIEIYRLPKAGGQKDVRLRFAAMGTDSWWFAVDNIAFYDVAPPAGGGGGGGGGQAPTLSIQRTTSGIRLTFTGTLQSADKVDGPYADETGKTSPADIATSGTTKFYRAKQ